MPPIRLGVIGAGLIWIRTHQPILTTYGDFECAAFCDVSEERRAAVAQEYPGARVLGDYRELLALDDIEAVLVLTPIPLNAPVAQAALEAGKHVIMEKPIARSVAEAQSLIAAARETGLRLYVLEQNAYRRAEDMLRELLASGEIGDLVLWECVQHLEADTAPGPLRFESTPWRKQADFPLGTLFDGGIHLIAGLSKVFGVPHSVDATGKQLRAEYGAYDHVAALLHYQAGFSGVLSHSSMLPPTRNHFYVYGSSGIVAVERERLSVERRGEAAYTVELPRESAYETMWSALQRAFVERREPFYTAERALCDVAILEAIDRSIASGSRIMVNAGVT